MPLAARRPQLRIPATLDAGDKGLWPRWPRAPGVVVPRRWWRTSRDSGPAPRGGHLRPTPLSLPLPPALLGKTVRVQTMSRCKTCPCIHVQSVSMCPSAKHVLCAKHVSTCPCAKRVQLLNLTTILCSDRTQQSSRVPPCFNLIMNFLLELTY